MLATSRHTRAAPTAASEDALPVHISKPTRIEAAGNLPKRIEEFVGRVNSGDTSVSVARMTSPPGWIEPGQAPEFDEVTLVLDGSVNVESRDGSLVVRAGEAVITRAGEWVRYSTPEGARYVAICLPAFAPDIVHRDE
jgi:quercetin dioxygenase-like cupin family protein